MPRWRGRKPEEPAEPALREDIDLSPIPLLDIVAHNYEEALRFAQQGQWERSHEWRDKARDIVNAP